MKKLILLMVLLCAVPVQGEPPPVKTRNVSSAAYEASHILKATPATLFWVSGYNSKGTAQFIQLFDSATLPADTAVPLLTITVAASSNFTILIPSTGMFFGSGIVISNSSTGPTKTIGSNDCYYTAVVK